MKTFHVEIEQRHIRRFTIAAESPQDATEGVLRGEGIEADDDHPEPRIFVTEREERSHGRS